MTWHRMIIAPWIIFGVYWAIGALRTRRTVQKEPFVARYGILFLEVVGFTLLFDEDAGFGFLGQRVMHRGLALAEMGIAMTWIGILIALWARWHLGQYWSARVTIKEDHKLIRTGPYARLRHPIYTGLDLAAIGAALTFDRWPMRGGCLRDRYRICDQGEEGRTDARRTVRGGVCGAPPACGIFAAEVVNRGSERRPDYCGVI